MKIKKQITKDGEGTVKITLEEPEDFYHIYQLICKGDHIRASTERKVISETSTGSVSSTRTRMNLTIEVDKISEYVPGSQELRISGRNKEENALVKLNAQHTLTLELNHPFQLRKSCWDSVFLDRLDQATNLSKRAEVLAVIMDMGLAQVCLVTDFLTVVQAKILMPIPKKRSFDAQHGKAVDRFFSQVLEQVMKHCQVDVVRCVVIASPGFVKDDFVKFVDTHATMLMPTKEEKNKWDLIKTKLLLVHSTSGHKHALTELLANPEVQRMLKDTKAAAETMALDRFFNMLHTDEFRAVYGMQHVQKALESAAVDQLLVCDDLFRTVNSKRDRTKLVQMVSSAKESGAQVVLCSRMHMSGEQLFNLGGVAAVLRYAMPHLDEEVELDNRTQQEEESDHDDDTLAPSFVAGFEPDDDL